MWCIGSWLSWCCAKLPNIGRFTFSNVLFSVFYNPLMWISLFFFYCWANKNEMWRQQTKLKKGFSILVKLCRVDGPSPESGQSMQRKLGNFPYCPTLRMNSRNWHIWVGMLLSQLINNESTWAATFSKNWQNWTQQGNRCIGLFGPARRPWCLYLQIWVR